MISENVKISFCNYAINFKTPENFDILPEKEMQFKSTARKAQEISDENRACAKKPEEYGKETSNNIKSDKQESESDSTMSGPKSLPTDFKVTNQQQLLNSTSEDRALKQNCSHSENNTAGQTTDKKVPDVSDVNKKSLLDNTDFTNDKQLPEDSNVPKASETIQEIMSSKDETKEPEDKTQDEGKMISTVYASNNSPKSSQADGTPHDNGCQPIDSNKQDSRYSVQASVSKTSNMNADSKVTRSETTMTSQTKQRRRTQRKVDGPIRRGTASQGRNRLEFDQYGRPKFKPSYEMVVDVAEFRFSRCSSDSNDDSDCDQQHGCPEVVETKSKKMPKKQKKKRKAKKVRDTKLRDTTDPEERYVPSDSDDESPWLNGVPPAPVRADVKSLTSFFKTRSKLKYGSNEKKIIFRKDSDYFPARLHSRTSFKQTSLGSTQGMSYFNSQFMNDSAGFPSTFSDLSLPPHPSLQYTVNY